MIFFSWRLLVGSFCFAIYFQAERGGLRLGNVAVPMLIELNLGQGNYVACLFPLGKGSESEREKQRDREELAGSCRAAWPLWQPKHRADPSGPPCLWTPPWVICYLPFCGSPAWPRLVGLLNGQRPESVAGSSGQVGKSRTNSHMMGLYHFFLFCMPDGWVYDCGLGWLSPRNI